MGRFGVSSGGDIRTANEMGLARTCAAQRLSWPSSERVGKEGQSDAGEGAGARGARLRGTGHAGKDAGGTNDRHRTGKSENRAAQSGLQHRAIRDVDGGARVK